MKRTIIAAALASGLVLTGCSGDDDEAEAKSAISDYLVAQQEDAQMITLEESEADCIADGMVEGIGVDQLQEYGLLADDLTVDPEAQTPEMSEEDSEVMVDAMFDCTDVMGTMEEELASAMGQQSPEVQECLQDALTEDVVRSVLVATFSGQQDQAQQQLMEPLGACISGDFGAPGGDG